MLTNGAKSTRCELDCGFRGKYPNAEVYPDGQPVICCARLGYRKYCGKSFDDNHEGFKVCFNCWNIPVEE